MRPIIALAPTPWRDIWMSRQHLLSRLGRKGWPITYSMGPASVWDRESSLWAERPLALTRVETVDGVQLVTGSELAAAWPKSAMHVRLMNLVHSRALLRSAGRRWRDRGMLFLFHPRYKPFIDILKPKHVVFHVFDVYSEMEQWDDEQERQLDSLCRRADLITAASDAIASALPEAGATKARVLSNGVDICAFGNVDALPCPPDLAAIPSPRIANVGSLNLKIDFSILATLVHARPDWNFVFVGPVNDAIISTDEDARANYMLIREAPNCHFLGGKPRELVPGYMAHMDVNLVCYLIKEGHWASKGYPLKLNEYLAAGRPVVATPTDAISRYFGDVVDIASTGEQFLCAVERALNSSAVGSAESRRRFARDNTWDSRVCTLDKWLHKLGDRRCASLPAVRHPGGGCSKRSSAA